MKKRYLDKINIDSIKVLKNIMILKKYLSIREFKLMINFSLGKKLKNWMEIQKIKKIFIWVNIWREKPLKLKNNSLKT